MKDPIAADLEWVVHLLPGRQHATRKRSNHFAYPVPDMLARFLARPHVQQPYREFPKLEAEKREALTHRRKSTLFLVHHQSWSRKLVLEALPRLSSLGFRSREQYHIVRVTDEHDRIAHRTVTATPLTIYLVKNDVGKQRLGATGRAEN